MESAHRFSPTLLLIGALAVLGGTAAAFLAVGVPSSTVAPISTSSSLSVPFAFDFLLGVPIVALIGVTAWSMISASEGSLDSKAPMIAIAAVILLLVAAIIVLHASIFPAAPVAHDRSGGAAGGSGKGGGGSGTGTGKGGNGTGSSGGGNGTGKGSGGGGGSGGQNNSTGSGGSNGTGGKGNGTSGGGKGNGTSGGGTNGTSGGGSGKKNGTGATTATPPVSPYVGWPVYAAGVALLLFVGALIVPQLADRWRQRRPRTAAPPPPPPAPPAAATAQLFAQAVRKLDGSADPRETIVDLYRQLLARLLPRVDIPDARTPEEIRAAHLIPLGVRAETAGVLTRLFEEACYSSHPLGGDAASLARRSAQSAEQDLRAAHAIG